MKIGLVAISIVVGFLLIACYYVIGFRCRKFPSLHNCITAMLTGSGAVCGITLALSPFVTDLKAHMADLDLYLAIGGFAVFYVSVHEFWKARPSPVAEIKQPSQDWERLPTAKRRESNNDTEG